jgi:hypothetical protein
MEAGAYYALGSTFGADSRFRDRQVSLMIGENGTKAIQLRLVRAAETAGGFK